MKFMDDNAIHTLKEDALGRAPFAEKLGDVIREWDRTESIVIALYGPWGSGKSSILDMAISHIRRTTETESKGPIVLNFNPWHFSDQAELLQMFFLQLYGQIRKYSPDIGLELETEFSKFAKALGALESAPKIGGFVSIAKVFLGFTSKETLEDHRRSIENIFRKLERRIVIVMDDIDRLTHNEIRHLFQIIKLNANFSNTLYLVAFDREVVEQALETELGNKEKARVYLEKIVQVGFDIPMVESIRVEEFLNNAIKEIITPIPQESWNSERWTDIYHSGFKSLFSNLRDVKRFVNSLSFTLDIVPTEVNPVDFIALEAIRIFLPDIYYEISRNKDLFTTINWPGRDIETKDKSTTLKQFLEKAGTKERVEIARLMCTRLFPPIQSYLGSGVYAPDHIPMWRRERRICSAEVFDTYFVLGLPKGEISQEEMSAIIASASDRTVFSSLLNQLIDQGKMARFLNLAQDKLDKLKLEHIKGFVESFVDLGENISIRDEGLSVMGSDFQIARLIYLSLMKLDLETRYAQFSEIIDNSQALYQLVFVVSLDSRSKEGSRRDTPIFDDESLKKLQEKCALKIEQWSKEGSLINSRHLGYILFRWLEWGKKSSVDKFIENATLTSEGLINLLKGFVTTVQVFNTSLKIEWQINMKNITVFVDPDLVIKKLDDLSDSEMDAFDNDGKRAVRVFRDSYSHWLATHKKDDFPYRSIED